MEEMHQKGSRSPGKRSWWTARGENGTGGSIAYQGFQGDGNHVESSRFKEGEACKKGQDTESGDAKKKKLGG